MAIITDLANWYPLTADVNDLASGNNGTNTGVSFVADGAITVADFNGTSSRFTTPNQANDPFSVENTTISVWVKSSTPPAANTSAIGSSYSSGGAVNPVYAMYFYNTGVANAYVRSNGGTSVSTFSTSSVLDGSWHLVTWTRTATQIKIYVDGALEGTSSFVGGGTLGNTNVLGVGCWVSVPNSNVAQFYQGKMSDLAAWRRVLSGAEITDIYNAGAGQLAGLIQLQAQSLFGSVVHDLPTGPPIYARTLFASVVHEGTAAPVPGGGDSPRWQGQSIQGVDLQGQSFQPSKDLA